MYEFIDSSLLCKNLSTTEYNYETRFGANNLCLVEMYGMAILWELVALNKMIDQINSWH